MQTTTPYMAKIITQKRIAGYTSRLLEGYNSIMAYDDNILSFRFSAYGTLILFNMITVSSGVAGFTITFWNRRSKLFTFSKFN